MQDEPYAYNKSVLDFLEFESLGLCFSSPLLTIFVGSTSLGALVLRLKTILEKSDLLRF